MDLTKELKEFVDAIKAALRDGRITALEAIEIVRELVDVLGSLLPLVITFLADADDQQSSSAE